MSTVSESQWRLLKEKQDAMVNDFIDGHDTEGVLRARLYGLGLRGDYLSSEVRQAVGRRADRQKPVPSTVLVIERDDEANPKRLRFNSIEAADKAVELLRKQPNVRLATREREGRDLIKPINPNGYVMGLHDGTNEQFVSNMLQYL